MPRRTPPLRRPEQSGRLTLDTNRSASLSLSLSHTRSFCIYLTRDYLKRVVASVAGMREARVRGRVHRTGCTGGCRERARRGCVVRELS